MTKEEQLRASKGGDGEKDENPFADIGKLEVNPSVEDSESGMSAERWEEIQTITRGNDISRKDLVLFRERLTANQPEGEGESRMSAERWQEVQTTLRSNDISRRDVILFLERLTPEEKA